MKRLFRTPIVSVLILLSFVSFGQTEDSYNALRVLNSQATEHIIKERVKIGSQNAIDHDIFVTEVAKKLGIPVERINQDGVTEILTGFGRDGKPIYTSVLVPPAIYQSVFVNAIPIGVGGESGYNLQGSGLEIGLFDVSKVRDTHLLFQDDSGNSRIDNSYFGSSTYMHFHSTLMAGMATGGTALGEDYRGVAPLAKIKALRLANQQAMETYYPSLPTSIHAYADGSYGSGYVINREDNILYSTPYHLASRASGNGSRSAYDNYSYYPYFCLTAFQKNYLTVGGGVPQMGQEANLDLFPYISPMFGNQAPGYVKGPTIDGRIKPDVISTRSHMLSASESSDTGFRQGGGTSSASAVASGVVVLLQELHQKYKGDQSFLKGATMKALLIHSASEQGFAEGPDFHHGWGRINAYGAAQIIEKNEGVFGTIREATLNNFSTVEYDVYANADEPLIVTLSWYDPPAEIPNNPKENANPLLVNDLDLRIIGPDGKEYMPYVLDFTDVCKDAFYGDNIRDNVEKVVVPRPSSTCEPYKIKITHKKTLQDNQQDFSLITTGIKNELNDEFFITQNLDVMEDEKLLWSCDQVLNDNLKVRIQGEGNISNCEVTTSGKSSIYVSGGGVLNIENTVLENQELYVLSGASITIHGDLNLIGGSKIFIEDGALVCVDNSSVIHLENIHNKIYVFGDSVVSGNDCNSFFDASVSGLGSVTDTYVQENMYIQNDVISGSSVLSSENIFVGSNVSDDIEIGDVVINNGSIIDMNVCNSVQFSKGVCIAPSNFSVNVTNSCSSLPIFDDKIDTLALMNFNQKHYTVDPNSVDTLSLCSYKGNKTLYYYFSDIVKIGRSDHDANETENLNTNVTNHSILLDENQTIGLKFNNLPSANLLNANDVEAYLKLYVDQENSPSMSYTSFSINLHDLNNTSVFEEVQQNISNRNVIQTFTKSFNYQLSNGEDYVIVDISDIIGTYLNSVTTNEEIVLSLTVPEDPFNVSDPISIFLFDGNPQKAAEISFEFKTDANIVGMYPDPDYLDNDFSYTFENVETEMQERIMVNKDENLLLYPNPAHEYVNVIFNSPYENFSGSLQVYSPFSPKPIKEIMIKEYSQNVRINIDTSGWKSGVYYFSLLDAKGEKIETKSLTVF